MMSEWKQVGWRSLKHQGYPKVVVRFTNGVGKLKFLLPDGEVNFRTQEQSQGRDADLSITSLTTQAEKVWATIKSGK